MSHPLDALLRDPWRLLEVLLDGSLHPGGREASERLLDRAGVDTGTRLLDIGCGSGEALRLARERRAHPVGLDREPTADGSVRGDMNSLPFHEGSFDVVLGECVLCLSSAFGQTLGEVDRVLTPGGRLAISDVTVSGPPPDLPAPIDELLCLDGPREQAHIRRQLVTAGFEIEDLRTHRDDLLSMRDQIETRLDTDRLEGVLGPAGERLRNGASQLEAAVESGRIGYVSIVARSRS